MAAVRSARLDGLTSLRGVAAAVVFLHHIPEALFPGGVNSFGYVGVTFFYVLSGFVLTWSSSNFRGPRRFYLRRLARVYPSHLAVFLVILLAAPLHVPKQGWGVTASHLFLLQAWSSDPDVVWGLNGVTWSLSCEMFFYLIFPLLIVAMNRVTPPVLLAGAAALLCLSGAVEIFAASQRELSPIWMIANSNPAIRAPEFILGAALARFVLDGRRLSPVMAAATATVCTVGFIFINARPAPNFWTTPLVGLLIVLVATSDAAWLRPLRIRPLVYAGEISFAFYLVHQVIVANAISRLGVGILPALLAFVLALGCAIVVHHVIEKPMFALLTHDPRSRLALGLQHLRSRSLRSSNSA